MLLLILNEKHNSNIYLKFGKLRKKIFQKIDNNIVNKKKKKKKLAME